jgi:hypothetical protein
VIFKKESSKSNTGNKMRKTRLITLLALALAAAAAQAQTYWTGSQPGPLPFNPGGVATEIGDGIWWVEQMQMDGVTPFGGGDPPTPQQEGCSCTFVRADTDYNRDYLTICKRINSPLCTGHPNWESWTNAAMCSWDGVFVKYTRTPWSLGTRPRPGGGVLCKESVHQQLELDYGGDALSGLY